LKISRANLNPSLAALVLAALGIIYSLLYYAAQSSQAQASTSGLGDTRAPSTKLVPVATEHSLVFIFIGRKAIFL